MSKVSGYHPRRRNSSLTAAPALAAITALCVLLSPAGLMAQEVATDAPVAANLTLILNTLLLLGGGLSFIFMAAGYMLMAYGASGRTSAVLAGLIALVLGPGAYLLIGYHLMYPGDAWVVPNYVGFFKLLEYPAIGDSAAGNLYAKSSDHFFQSTAAAIAPAVIALCLLGRVSTSSFAIATVLVAGVIYPIEGSWQWGAGWLSSMGFSDFAGGSIIYAAAGAMGLAASVRFSVNRAATSPARPFALGAATVRHPTAEPNPGFVAAGAILVFIGFLGANSASQLSVATSADISSVARIVLNTLLAGTGGLAAGLLLSRLNYGGADFHFVVMTTLGGLVMISAEPLTPTPLVSVAIGAGAAIVVAIGKQILESMVSVDPLGASLTHLGCGVVGTLPAPVTNSGLNVVIQAVGAAAITVFAFAASIVVWAVIGRTGEG